MSICYMIFVEEPYYNEPGYESRRPVGDVDVRDTGSFKYNSDVRTNTLETAILGHLWRPDPDFGDLIKSLLTYYWTERKQTYLKWAEREYPLVRSRIHTLINEIDMRVK